MWLRRITLAEISTLLARVRYELERAISELSPVAWEHDPLSSEEREMKTLSALARTVQAGECLEVLLSLNSPSKTWRNKRKALSVAKIRMLSTKSPLRTKISKRLWTINQT